MRSRRHPTRAKLPRTLVFAALACGLFAGAATAGEDDAESTERAEVLIWPFKGNGVVEAATVRTVQTLVTVELSEYPHLSVISSDDVQKALDIESERQIMGCDEDSCMAEAAGALGAELVLIGELGRLGDLMFVNLSFLDTTVVRAEARTSIPVPVDQLDTLPALLKPALQDLVVKVLSHRGYVVDRSPPPPETSPIPGLAVAGAGALAIASAAGLGVVAWQLGYVPALAQIERISRAQQGNNLDAAKDEQDALAWTRIIFVSASAGCIALGVTGSAALVGGAAWATIEGAE